MNAYIILKDNKASCIYKVKEGGKKAPSVIKYIAMNMIHTCKTAITA